MENGQKQMFGRERFFVAGHTGPTKEIAALRALVGRDWEKQARLADMQWQVDVDRQIYKGFVQAERAMTRKAMILMILGHRLFARLFPREKTCGFEEESTFFRRFLAATAIAAGRFHHDHDGLKSYDFVDVGYFRAMNTGYTCGATVINLHVKGWRVNVEEDYECTM